MAPQKNSNQNHDTRWNRPLIAIFTLGVALFVSACSVHRIDIQQGNVITEEARVQLQLGMTREQVQFLLGTPLLIDSFHKDRWDYVYNFIREGEEPEEQRLSLFFQQDKLVRVIQDITGSKPEKGWPFLKRDKDTTSKDL